MTHIGLVSNYLHCKLVTRGDIYAAVCMHVVHEDTLDVDMKAMLVCLVS
jgi:hypothetical protein